MNETPKQQAVRYALLIVMSAVIFGTAIMIITALITLSDLRRDVRGMNDQIDKFQQQIINLQLK